MLVAHISDLHQLSLEGVRVRDFLGKRLTGGLNLLFNRGGNYPREVLTALAEDLKAMGPDHLAPDTSGSDQATGEVPFRQGRDCMI